MKLLTSIVCISLCLTASYSRKTYEGYQVYSVNPKTLDQVHAINALHDEYDFWGETKGIGHDADILVTPQQYEHFHNFLLTNNLAAEAKVADVQRYIDDATRQEQESPRAGLEWTSYHTLEEIYAWLDAQAAKYPNIETVVGGKTYEGRDIKGITITNGPNLPGVIIESGIHAREWIGPAASSWIINEIINSAANSTWKKYNYLYFPNFNPDGYVYTWTDDRLWRKTRKPYANQCVGADPNRNFDNHWMVAGSSNNPCSEVYGGPEPFSEIETRSLSEYLGNVSSKYDLYIAFHSAAQVCLYPWGWTTTPTPLEPLWQRIGDLAADAIYELYGTEFDVGSTYDAIYPASATSVDWYYGQFNSTISYTFEMRTGYGFVMPPEFIIPCGEEHLAGLLAILNEYQKL